MRTYSVSVGFSKIAKRFLRQGAELHSLNSGATSEDLQRLESVFSVRLPADFVSLWSEHDGLSLNVANVVDRQLGTIEFLSVARIIDARTEILAFRAEGMGEGWDSTGPVRPSYYDPAWLPFACIDESDRFLLLDFHPAEGGVDGQVILADFKNLSDREVVAPYLATYLLRLDVPEPTPAKPAPTKTFAPKEQWLRVSEILKRYASAGVNLGKADDDAMEIDARFMRGVGPWNPELHAASVFLRRVDAFNPSPKPLSLDDRVAEVNEAAQALGIDFSGNRDAKSEIAMLRDWNRTEEFGPSIPDTVCHLLQAVDKRLRDLGSSKRIYRVKGNGTSYRMRFVLLEPEQREALAAAGLVAFWQSLIPDKAPGPKKGLKARFGSLFKN